MCFYVPASPTNLISPQKLDEKLPDCSIYTEGPMTIFGFAGKHIMKTIHHPPHCDLPIYNGDDRSVETLLEKEFEACQDI